MTKTPLNLVVLISGNGSNLQAILDSIAVGELPARVSAVISDRADAFGLKRAARAGVPAQVVARDAHAGRAGFDAALLRCVDSLAPDLIVLAGFMRVLPPQFVSRFARRIINIHPSLLPKFKGLDTHQRALDAGERWHGATVHFVTAELDAGPRILQGKVEVAPDDDAGSLRARVLREEHRLYPRAIRWFAENRHARARACAR
ncbi:MAG: phosphoribosylglycinamide formyltransferase [Gammaproteobacteria bacterium]